MTCSRETRLGFLFWGGIGGGDDLVMNDDDAWDVGWEDEPEGDFGIEGG